MKINYKIVLFLLIGYSCTKEKVPLLPKCNVENIVEPLEYFPAFPGTWWKYEHSNGSEITYSISEDYEEYEGSCLPEFMNLNHYINQNKFVLTVYLGLGNISQSSSVIYSTVKDSMQYCPISFATFLISPFGNSPFPYRRVAKNIDTTIVLNGVTYNNVIEMYEFNGYDPNHRYFEYFAKNIGLIKRDSLDVNDTTQHIRLMTIKDFHIGN